MIKPIGFCLAGFCLLLQFSSPGYAETRSSPLDSAPYQKTAEQHMKDGGGYIKKESAYSKDESAYFGKKSSYFKGKSPYFPDKSPYIKGKAPNFFERLSSTIASVFNS